MEEEKKKTSFLFVFSTYLPVFFLKFQSGELVGCRIKLRIQRVPNRHAFDGPSSHFSGIYCFWGSGVRQKYSEWVLVGWGIYFHIQWSLSIEIWLKTWGHMSKIQTKKVVFFMITIPKFILKKCLRPIRYFKFKAISLANTWLHWIWVKVKRPILSWNFL